MTTEKQRKVVITRTITAGDKLCYNCNCLDKGISYCDLFDEFLNRETDEVRAKRVRCGECLKAEVEDD